MTAAPGSDYFEIEKIKAEKEVLMVGESVFLSLGDDYSFECLVWMAIPKEKTTWSFQNSDSKPVKLNPNENFVQNLGKVRRLFFSPKVGQMA